MAAAAEAEDVPYLYINVCGSKVLEGDGGKYVLYTIRSISSDPCFKESTYLARRRYSEFVQLKELLESRHEIEIPSLSQSINVGEDEFDESFRKERMRYLQVFILKLLSNPELKADDCVYLFVQTDYSMSVIQEVVSRKSEKEVLSIVDYSGNKEASHDKPSSSQASNGSSAANGSKSNDRDQSSSQSQEESRQSSDNALIADEECMFLMEDID